MLGRLVRRLMYFLRREQRTAELEEEMRLHIELRARKYGEGGLDVAQAGAHARRRFGEVGRLVEASRDVWGYQLADALRQDLRYALRQLVRAPLFTIIASLSVAVGVIVAVIAFTLMNTLLFKSLPVPNPQDIYHLYTSDYDGREDRWGSSSYRDFQDFQRSNAFASLAASDWSTLAVSIGDQAPLQEWASFVSPNYFDALGLRVAQGSAFRGGAELEIVITHPYWQRAFGGAPDVIGKTVRVNAFPVTVVGVAPPSFRGVSIGPPVIGWMPAATMPMLARNGNVLTSRGSRGFSVFGRLRAGENSERAAQQLNALAAALAEQEPDAWRDANKETRLVTVLPHRESYLTPQINRMVPLVVALAALLVGFVVLLACTNVAALMLGRAAGRESEVAVRLTLGATRARLIRQLFTESLLLAAIGGTLSFIGLQWTLSLARGIRLVDGLDLRSDWRVVIAAAGTSLLCALAFGLAPVLHSLRVDLRARIGGNTRRQKNRMRGMLIAFQVAAACVLILLAGSVVRGVRAFVASDPGVKLDGLVAMEIDLHMFGDDTARSRVYLTQVKELMASSPGIQNASATALMPLGGSRTGAYLHLPNGEKHEVEVNTVGSAFFATIGVGPFRGRVFQSSDRRGSVPVAVVNRAFLQRYGAAMLGQSVGINDHAGITIVGAVPEIQYHDPREAAEPLIYLVDDQLPWGSDRRTFLLRVAPGNEGQVAGQVRQGLRQRFPDLVIPWIESMRDYTAKRTMPQLVAGRVALAVGGVELALASIGLYGLLLFALLARRREIGVRLALGASAREASWAVMRDGLRYALYGVAAGIVLGVPATMIAQQAVPGARMGDPAPFIFALVAVLSAVGCAAWVPARKAGRVQPAAALRHE